MGITFYPGVEYVKCVNHSVVFDSLEPMDWTPPGFSVHGILQARIFEWFVFPSPGMFLTQGLNLSLQHSRQILYYLSYQGNPTLEPITKKEECL